MSRHGDEPVRDEGLYSIHETARRLRLGDRVVLRMVRAGQLAGVVPAGSARVKVTGASIRALAGARVDDARLRVVEEEPAGAREVRSADLVAAWRAGSMTGLTVHAG